jgi:UDP-N-acetylglucosamine 2-epimerase (non-hydrolysing)
MKIVNVVGARPNFMKIMPIIEAIENYNRRKGKRVIKDILVHTGQHYDKNMSIRFFNDLEIRPPDIYLGVGSATQAMQTAKIMIEFEKVLIKERPDLVLVVGDVNSTLACSLVAAKLHIPIAHVEAGLRSFDTRMPEEINRRLTDALATFLFTPSKDANENLKKEGIAEDKIYFVGNVMIDTLFKYLKKAKKSKILFRLGLAKSNNQPKDYAVLTLHRPANVDDKKTLSEILIALKKISKNIPILFPVHPRTKKQIKSFDLERVVKDSQIILTEPLGYLDFLNLFRQARFVLTDSGGIQEETTVLGIPCLTLRENTERMITVKEGTNIVVGTNPEKIINESLKILKGNIKRGRIPKLWDGYTAERIVRVLCKRILKVR